jgi:hypothetical protein
VSQGVPRRDGQGADPVEWTSRASVCGNAASCEGIDVASVDVGAALFVSGKERSRAANVGHLQVPNSLHAELAQELLHIGPRKGLHAPDEVSGQSSVDGPVLGLAFRDARVATAVQHGLQVVETGCGDLVP